MPANRFGIDVGQLYREKEAIEGARTRNKLSALQLSEAQRAVDERPIREAQTQKRNAMVTDLKQKAIGGDKDARDKLLVIDSSTKAFMDHIDKADAKQAAQAQENIEQMGRMVSVVRNVKDPEQREAKYQQAKGMLPQEIQAKWPKNYNQNDVDLTLAKLKLMSDVAEYKVLKHGDESLLVKGGDIVERKSTTSEENNITPAQQLARDKYTKNISDTNQKNLYKDIAGLASADINADGDLIVFKKDAAKWNQAMTLALKFMADGKYNTTTEAALQAAKKYGLVSDKQLASDTSTETSTETSTNKAVGGYNKETGKVEYY